ncbi:sigma-70 family RNA polymerase sigma factor [Nocardia sp. CDC153]|uniref:RNA polymerase sigma factor n=1 Tax=Nocardia sp. CDC153 TaxID=3112167 RepID=UPI002DB68020|nr:sigma-70 family RNA polymerase sigma factor [Nocardia sp. CDC153]MEC3952900.1 sigma-70 family RNA polymerase sigma factor [Nocardia sp. CDC153]
MTANEPTKDKIPLQSNEDPKGIDAYKSFYRDHAPSLVRFLICQGASLPDANEIAQETMTLLWERWIQVEYPKTWTWRVAQRKLIKRRTERRERLVAEIPEHSVIYREDAEIKAWEELFDRYSALETLPLRQRQVFTWWLEGYTTTEIAEQLDISADAARANLAKARRSFAKNWTDINKAQ